MSDIIYKAVMKFGVKKLDVPPAKANAATWTAYMSGGIPTNIFTKVEVDEAMVDGVIDLGMVSMNVDMSS